MAGAQQTLLTLLEGIDREHFAPYVVVPYRGELSIRVEKLDIPVITRELRHWVPCIAGLSHQRRLQHLWRLIPSLRSRVWAIAALIERFRIELVYTNTVTCIEGALAARTTNRPHVWHIHEPIKGNSELLPLLPTWIYSKVISILSNRVIFPSVVVSRDYPALADKQAIVYNGLPMPSAVDRIAAHNEVAALLGLDPTRQLVGVVGAIQPRKDHYTFVKAAEIIAKEKNDVDFVIVGSGGELHTQKIRKFVKDFGLEGRIKIPGRWPGSIQTMMAAIDVLAISSEQESFGLTAIESMAMETPVVSTRCGGPEEIIEDNSNGFLVNRKDAKSMAEAMLKLLNEPLLARRFGAAGRIDVLKRFTQERYVNGVQDAMLDVCGIKSVVTNHENAGGGSI